MNLRGQQFGKLTVLDSAGSLNGNMLWLCFCDCGVGCTVTTARLRGNRTRSCGCLQDGNPKHGHAKRGRLSPTYHSWAGMIQRCNDPKHSRYADYGGRGITVCKRWHTFADFLADMGERPVGMTIDRIDVNGNYELGNCRWADDETQRKNKRGKHQ